MAMNVVLKNRVEASERSANELGSLIEESNRAGICRDVEALIEQVIDIFGDLNTSVEQWQTDIEGGKAQHKDATARSFFDLYVRLEKIAFKTSQLGREMESWGYQLKEKRKFRAVWRQLKGIVCLDMDRVTESIAQIRRGETMALGDFADELSREFGQ